MIDESVKILAFALVLGSVIGFFGAKGAKQFAKNVNMPEVVIPNPFLMPSAMLSQTKLHLERQ